MIYKILMHKIDLLTFSVMHVLNLRVRVPGPTPIELKFE